MQKNDVLLLKQHKDVVESSNAFQKIPLSPIEIDLTSDLIESLTHALTDKSGKNIMNLKQYKQHLHLYVRKCESIAYVYR
jgi:hypothetical protein